MASVDRVPPEPWQDWAKRATPVLTVKSAWSAALPYLRRSDEVYKTAMLAHIVSVNLGWSATRAIEFALNPPTNWQTVLPYFFDAVKQRLTQPNWDKLLVDASQREFSEREGFAMALERARLTQKWPRTYQPVSSRSRGHVANRGR